jgi:hypothetical protein
LALVHISALLKFFVCGILFRAELFHETLRPHVFEWAKSAIFGIWFVTELDALRRSARISKLDRKTNEYISGKTDAQDTILDGITRKQLIS